jgi:hypothetical protein
MKTPILPDALKDPIAFMALAKSKAPSLEVKSKEVGFAGERGRLEADRDAALLRMRNIAEYDRVVESVVAKLIPFLGKSQKFVFLKSDIERLVTLWQGKYMPMARLGVSDQGEWNVSNDRDEIELVPNGTQAIQKFLEILAPTFRENERARQSEAERPARQDAQEAHIKAERKKRLTV